MCRSMTTASGPSSSASSIAARPSSAVPTTASCGCRSISGESASRKGCSSSARRTRIVPPASASRMGPQVSLVRHVFATTSSQSLGNRGCTRPRPGPPWGGHGPIGDPLCGAGCAPRRARARVRGLRKRRDGRGRGHDRRRRAGSVSAPDQGHVAADRDARGQGRARRLRAGRARWGPLGGPWHAGGPRRGARTGRDDLDRCARRSEQSRHEPERKRARHGARRCARSGRRPVPRGRLGLARGVARPCRSRRGPLAGRRRAGSAPRARRKGVHDERRRPSWASSARSGSR